MHPAFASEPGEASAIRAGRVQAPATWIGVPEPLAGTAELATGDEEPAREPRRALEIAASHDPGIRLVRAEATKRETRLEFLTHLDRLAHRIEQRRAALGHAEAGTERLTEAVGGARVVTLHETARQPATRAAKGP